MGTAIAIEHAAHSIPVVLMDKSPEALRRRGGDGGGRAGGDRAEWEAGSAASSRLPTPWTTADLGGCDLVLESIVEKRPAKQAAYAQIKPRLARPRDPGHEHQHDSHCAAGRGPGRSGPILRTALLPSGPAASVGRGDSRPGDKPGNRWRAIVAHAASLGKLPLVVADGPGFVVNRLLLTYLNEALALVTAGVSIQQIDTAMASFGMPLGPLELLDEIGLDTALQSGIVLAEIFGERSGGSELLVRLVKAQQYGIKAGAGFYRYPGKTPNPSCW